MSLQKASITASASHESLESIETCAARLSVSPWTVRKWIQEGRIGSNKLGARRLIPASEIQRLIRESAVPALAAAK